MSSTPSSPESPRTSGTHDAIPVDIDGFTEEERQEITSRIEKIARGTTLGGGDIFNQIKPTKKGSVFPLVVNILAILFIAAGIYLSNHYFNQRIQELNMQAGTFEGAEGKILEEVKREAERKIQEKESEISRIREDLQRIEEQRLSLQENMQEQIAAKEQELLTELELALEAERNRLQSAGISEEELAESLENFRSTQEAEYRDSLAEFRSETLEQLRLQEEELIEAKTTAERILQEANREREELLAEAQQREDELQRQFSETQQELQALEAARSNEQLVRDQINGLYVDIQASIQEGDAQSAREKIGELKDLLQSPSVRNIPNLAKRIQVDTYMIDLLEDEAAGASAKESDQSLLEAAKLVTSIRAAVEEAQNLQEQGELYEARRYYNRAIEMLPAVKTAVENTNEIRVQEEAAQLESLISEGDQMVSEGESAQAIELYTAAAIEASTDHSGLDRSATEKLLQLMEQEISTAEQRNAELSRRIAQLQQEVVDARSSARQAESQSSETVEELNEEIQVKDTRIASLQNTIRSKEEEITSLKSNLDELEEKQVRLTAQYREAEMKVRDLNTELEGAVDQITRLITLSESNRRLRDAVGRYQEFEQQSSQLISSGDRGDKEAALEEFERFIRSSEIREIFPELPELYEQLP